MTTKVRILIGLALSALLTTTALAHDVTYDYDRSQDFSLIRTYALSVTPSDNPFVDERIASAINAQLAFKGLRKDDVHPDVHVTANQSFETHDEYTAYSSGGYGLYDPYWGMGWGGWGGWGYGGWGYGSGWGGYTNVTVEKVTVRTLTIDLTAAGTDKLVWRGVSERTMHSMKPEKITRKTNKDVAEIFENYPPQEDD